MSSDALHGGFDVPQFNLHMQYNPAQQYKNCCVNPSTAKVRKTEQIDNIGFAKMAL